MTCLQPVEPPGGLGRDGDFTGLLCFGFFQSILVIPGMLDADVAVKNVLDA